MGEVRIWMGAGFSKVRRRATGDLAGGVRSGQTTVVTGVTRTTTHHNLFQLSPRMAPATQRTKAQEDALAAIVEDFSITPAVHQDIIKAFHSAMERGLQEESRGGGGLPMLPSFV